MTQTITRKPYKGTSQTLPVLGFGLMRLPQKDGKIDMETAQAMVDLAMEHGCNYFDTAYIYHEGESERFTAKAFAKYPRSSYILATKMPTVHLKKKEDMERIFNEQLERTQAGYFDIYLMHWLNEDHWKTALDLDLYAFMKEKQAQGLIRKIGFSFHGTPELLEKIAEAYPWDIAQIQLNYLDWELMRAKEQYEILTRHGIPVLVMEPLRGGTLANLPEEAAKHFREYAPGKSQASWGLRFAMSKPNVQLVLSGMSDPEQMKDNLATVSPLEEMKEPEYAVLEKVLASYRKTRAVPCTRCAYCMPCPAGVNIPWNLAVCNQIRNSKSLFSAGLIYESMEEKARASQCISCGKCLSKCPQKINIPGFLAEVREAFAKEKEK